MTVANVKFLMLHRYIGYINYKREGKKIITNESNYISKFSDFCVFYKMYLYRLFVV